MSFEHPKLDLFGDLFYDLFDDLADDLFDDLFGHQKGQALGAQKAFPGISGISDIL